MANKDRNKRSVRQARAAERERVAEAQASATTSSDSKKLARAQASKSVDKPKKEAKKTGIIARTRRYLSDVRIELKRVTWPSRQELTSWSVAVIIALAVFGVCVWAVDTGFVALLVGFTGLRG